MLWFAVEYVYLGRLSPDILFNSVIMFLLMLRANILVNVTLALSMEVIDGSYFSTSSPNAADLEELGPVASQPPALFIWL